MGIMLEKTESFLNLRPLLRMIVPAIAGAFVAGGLWVSLDGGLSTVQALAEGNSDRVEEIDKVLTEVVTQQRVMQAQFEAKALTDYNSQVRVEKALDRILRRLDQDDD